MRPSEPIAPNALSLTSVPSTDFQDGAAVTELALLSTFQSRNAITLDIPPDLAFRVLYFGWFADNAAAAGATWKARFTVELSDDQGRVYALQGLRGVASLDAPSVPGGARSSGRSLPGCSVRVFAPSAQDWSDAGVSYTGGVQWVEQIEADGRIVVCDPAPHYLVGRFRRAVLRVTDVVTSGTAGTEQMHLWLAVKSSNLPLL